MKYAYANGHIAAAQRFMEKLNDAILWPIVSLLLAAAVVYFLWGAFQYLTNANDATGRATGARHMFWGIIGITVMVTALTLLFIVTRTLFGDGPVGEAETFLDL